MSSHDPPDGPRDDAPGKVFRKCLGGRKVELIWPAWQKRIEDPDSWYTEVLKSIRDPKTDIKSRIALISLVGEESDSNERARRALKKLLMSDRLPAIRAKCAESLQDAAAVDSTVVKLIFDRLDNDTSDVVRAECAEALRTVAPEQVEVRNRLEELFESGPEVVRSGAARGLSRLDFCLGDHHAISGAPFDHDCRCR